MFKKKQGKDISMEKQRRTILSATFVLALLVGVVLVQGSLREDFVQDSRMDKVDLNQARNSSIKAVFTDQNKSLGTLELEKADEPEERRKGLMDRQSLENGTGMIFVWENSENRTFWMKNTYISLDMIFITAEKTIRTIKQADPEPNVSDSELKVYSSEGPARYVIEARQNFTERKGIEEGHEVSFNLSN